MHFGAQSRGLRAPCERFAPGVTPGPRITRFRLAADLGRMGLVTHRVSNKVSKITSRHLVPLDRAFPAHALCEPAEHDVGHVDKLVFDDSIQNRMIVAMDGAPPGRHTVDEFCSVGEAQPNALGGNNGKTGVFPGIAE